MRTTAGHIFPGGWHGGERAARPSPGAACAKPRARHPAAETRAALKAGFDAAPRTWLLQFFGNASTADDLRAALARPVA